MAETRTGSVALLHAWFSPAFPTGAFAYSQGLETAVRQGWVDSADTLGAWIGGQLRCGAAWTDAVLLAEAYAARALDAAERLAEAAELGGALAVTSERRRESLALGEAFARAVREGWPGALPVDAPDPPVHPVVAGAAAAGLGLELGPTLQAYLAAGAANLISAAIRLGVFGQVAGVRVLAAACEHARAAAARAECSSLDDLGACGFGAEIAAMRHETLHGRLFIS